jgi:formylmethanofuran dehydrogenase subunit C
MSLKLVLKHEPEVPLEAEVITPPKLNGLSIDEITKLPLQYGNERVELGEFFRVEGSYSGEIHVEGDLARVKLVGAGMSEGRIVVHGRIGMHLGAGISGGEILVEGDAGDWVAPEMSGGRIVIKGNAGHMIGSAYRGSPAGIRGGEIIIHGNAGNEIGHAMRKGLIAIGGDSGDFTGVDMCAGTIIVIGDLGNRTGAGMKRGSIVSMRPAQMLPTFSYACSYQPQFLRLYLLHLSRLGLPVTPAYLNGRYQRWSGDALEMNRGEVLLLSGEAA